MGRGPMWPGSDDRLLRNIIACESYTAYQIFERYNQLARVKRGCVALASRISTQRYVITDFYDVQVGGLPGALRTLDLPAPNGYNGLEEEPGG